MRGRGFGRGGRGGDRGGRGRGGGFNRPRTAVHTDADGNPVEQRERGQRQPFRGKPREDGHPYDRQDGTGKGRRGDKKGGHGKANWGAQDDKVYKKKGEETEEKKAEETVEEKKEPEPQYVEEIVGYSLEDFLADKSYGTAKEARKAEGVKDKNTKAHGEAKEKQSTVLAAKQAATTNLAGNTNELRAHLGITAGDDDVPAGGRGGRGGRNQEGGQRGGRRQNARAALKKTEDDFPAL